jgi:hypothetical protein
MLHKDVRGWVRKVEWPPSPFGGLKLNGPVLDDLKYLGLMYRHIAFILHYHFELTVLVLPKEALLDEGLYCLSMCKLACPKTSVTQITLKLIHFYKYEKKRYLLRVYYFGLGNKTSVSVNKTANSSCIISVGTVVTIHRRLFEDCRHSTYWPLYNIFNEVLMTAMSFKHSAWYK